MVRWVALNFYPTNQRFENDVDSGFINFISYAMVTARRKDKVERNKKLPERYDNCLSEDLT